MITEYDIIHTLIRTEKATSQEPLGKYVFQVSRQSNKVEIKKAVATIYKVRVADVRIINVPGKRKRVRQDFGLTSAWKKAIVTLEKGQKIEIV